MSDYPLSIVDSQIIDAIPLEILLDHLAKAARLADQMAQQSTLEDYRKVKRPNTLRRQRSEIALFEQFLAEMQVPLTGLGEDLSLWAGMSRGLIIAFKIWLEKKGYRFGTINLCLSTLRVYCGMSYVAGHLPVKAWQPIDQLHNVSLNEARILDEKRQQTSVGLKKAKATPISPSQMILLKKKLRESDDPVASRDLLMICLLADHGMRVSEVAGLLRNQVDLVQTRFLIDRRKTNLIHFHKFLPDTIEAMQKYLSLYEREPEKTLLGIKVAAIRWRINNLGQLINISLSPHDLRHYFATYAKGDLLDIAKAGGWTNVNMILRYRLDQQNANENITMPASGEE